MRLTALLATLLAGFGVLQGCGDQPTIPHPPVTPTVTPCTMPDARCRARIEIEPGRFLPYYATQRLDVGDPTVTRGLVMVHGTDRNADDYFETAVLAGAAAGQLETTTIVAPQFQTLADAPRPDEPYWTSSGWKRGNLSEPGGPAPRVSSYAAMDAVVRALGDRARFPKIAAIVVTGHSAGGQLVHRFAAGSDVENEFSDITVRYVVANPSSYLYIGPEREWGASFVVPDTSACSNYNDWHYGLENLNAYMTAVGVEKARDNLVHRPVVILLGSEDTGTHLLDQSCAANLEGPYRFARGETLIRFTNQFYPGNHHVQMVVPDVGHSSRDMYTSQVGLQALFGP